MNMQELNELDFSNIGEWPAAIKAILILILCGGVGAAWYFLDIEDQYKAAGTGSRIPKRTCAWISRVSRPRRRTSRPIGPSWLRWRSRSVPCCASCRTAPRWRICWSMSLRPAWRRASSSSLFQPQPEVPKDFYAELPIKIRVVGTYHEFGEFVSGLAALPRIVTIHDVQITAAPEQARAAGDGGNWRAPIVILMRQVVDDEEVHPLGGASVAGRLCKPGHV